LSLRLFWFKNIFSDFLCLRLSSMHINKGNNKITELRTILQRESQNSLLYKQTKSVLFLNTFYGFFRNACTKSGSLRFSQFSGCWLILSVYIIMSLDFPFLRLFGVR
jgi:hypothetical protein